MAMLACVTSDNFEGVAKEIKLSHETEFDFSGSSFQSPESVKEIFLALADLRKPINVIFHNCEFKTSYEVLLELRMDVMSTKNLHKIEFTGMHWNEGNMEYLVSGLCRNGVLREVALDDVIPYNSPIMVDLNKVVPVVSMIKDH